MADLHGWQSDPFDLHQERYFSQGQPTKLVRDGGVESYDPPPTSTPMAAPRLAAGAFPSGPASPQESVPDSEKVLAEPSPTPQIPPLPDSSAPGAQPAHPATPTPGPGWWLASDGNWYPPDAHPATPTPGPGWWLASDGNWYPPEAHPDAAPFSPVTGSE